MKPYGSLKEGDIVYKLEFDEKILDTFFICLSKMLRGTTNIKFISRFMILLFGIIVRMLWKRTAVGGFTARLSKDCRSIGNAR